MCVSVSINLCPLVTSSRGGNKIAWLKESHYFLYTRYNLVVAASLRYLLCYFNYCICLPVHTLCGANLFIVWASLWKHIINIFSLDGKWNLKIYSIPHKQRLVHYVYMDSGIVEWPSHCNVDGDDISLLLFSLTCLKTGGAGVITCENQIKGKSTSCVFTTI